MLDGNSKWLVAKCPFLITTTFLHVALAKSTKFSLLHAHTSMHCCWFNINNSVKWSAALLQFLVDLLVLMLMIETGFNNLS
jgi:hypothetical protein